MSQTYTAPAFMPDDFVAGRVLLRNISWDTYSALLADVGDGAARLTYDNGLLEIELPSRLHEQIKAFVAEMIIAVMKRLAIKYEPAGATTWRKHEDLRGLEADECYHIQNVARVVGKSELNLSIDPPPDLVVEIEVASLTLNKIEIYRSLKVPEVWRVTGDSACTMFKLDANGVYQPISTSIAIPAITAAIVSHYLLLREQSGHTDGIRQFEKDVVEKLATP